MNDRRQAGALLAALRHNLVGIRAQLDRLSDDELDDLGGALYDVATELRFTLRDRGREFDLLPVDDGRRRQRVQGLTVPAS